MSGRSLLRHLPRLSCVRPGRLQQFSRAKYSASAPNDDTPSISTSKDTQSLESDEEFPSGRVEEPVEGASTKMPSGQVEELLRDASGEAERIRQWQEYRRTKSQASHSYRPLVDPRDTSVVLFPGQGTQFVGMADKLLEYPNVPDMFRVASKILGYNLLDICLHGPQDKLNKTVHCQPAVLVTSLAAVEKLKCEKPWAIENCISTAGFSVGEFAALVFAGAMSFEDAVQVVKVRAEAMQKASEATPSGMMTVYLQRTSKPKYACHVAREYCTRQLNLDNPVCAIANYLFTECKVLAGNTEALDFIAENARDFGLLRPRRLPVSGAFHTPLMLSVRAPLLGAFKSIQLRSPVIPVHSNLSGKKYRRSPKMIYESLIKQVHSPVLWEQTMHILYTRPEGEDFPFTFEMGPGNQLTSMLKRTNKKATEQCEAVEV